VPEAEPEVGFQEREASLSADGGATPGQSREIAIRGAHTTNIQEVNNDALNSFSTMGCLTNLRVA
jgi:hypothetical protein